MGCEDVADMPKKMYSHHACQDEFLDCISDVLMEELKDKLNQSDFIGIMIDESTDISISHKMVFYTKLMNCSGRSEIHFLKNIEVCDGTAEGIIVS